jgi:endo-1,4-beta-xylanase
MRAHIIRRRRADVTEAAHTRWGAIALGLAALLLAGCGGSDLCAHVSATGATTAASQPFRSAIPLGAAVRWDRLQDSPGYARFYDARYSWMTPENELKMNALEPQEGSFDFGTADALVAWARAHGKLVHGHVLVWSQQNPSWVASLDTPQKALSALDTYVTTVIRHFARSIGEWDVVNEAINADGSYVENVWYRELGPGYIVEAYRAARAADPAAHLCYNDLGTELPGPHSDAELRLVQRLRALGLLDCVGFELHTQSPGPPAATLQHQLRTFAATGAYVLISELDVVAAPNTDPTSAVARLSQATTYSAIANACVQTRGCNRITTWGFTDASTWLGSAAAPLPFDVRCVAKPAWAALRVALGQPATIRSTRR